MSKKKRRNGTSPKNTADKPQTGTETKNTAVSQPVQTGTVTVEDTAEKTEAVVSEETTASEVITQEQSADGEVCENTDTEDKAKAEASEEKTSLPEKEDTDEIFKAPKNAAASSAQGTYSRTAKKPNAAQSSSKKKQTKKTSKTSSKQNTIPKNEPEPIEELSESATVASISKKERTKLIASVVIMVLIALAAAVMMIRSVMRGQFFFALEYLIPMILCISVVIVRANMLLPTYAAVDGGRVVLCTYDNKLVPYDVFAKAGFFCDFIPAKRTKTELNARRIERIIIGTKKYLERYSDDDERFMAEMEKIKNSAISEKTLRRTDMMYILLENGKSAFMSIEGFDAQLLADFVRECMRKSPECEILCNSRLLRSKILFDLPSK